jgi:hypothetical protein
MISFDESKKNTVLFNCLIRIPYLLVLKCEGIHWNAVPIRRLCSSFTGCLIFSCLLVIGLYCHLYECDSRWGFDWWLDLLTTLTHDSLLHLIIVPSLISTLYKLLQHTLSLFSLLCLHQSFPGNGFWQSRFFSFCTHLVACWLSTVPTKSSLHRLPYNSHWTLASLALLVTSQHGTQRKHRSLLYSNRFQGNMFVCESVTQ